MGLIELLILIAVVGFLVWALTTYVPMPQPFKTAIVVIAVIVLILITLRALGIGDVPLRR
jgi:hypothetical protein